MINLVFGSHSDRFRLLAFLKSIGKGSQGLRDCEIEKGLILGVGCVDVLEFNLGLVSASLALH